MVNEDIDVGMPLHLVLVRHGHSEGNRAQEAGDPSLMTTEYRNRAAADWRLTDRGRDQAKEAGRWVQEWMAGDGGDPFDRLYCSPYARARETAALLDLPEAGWRLEPMLRERDWGLWEGLAKQTTKERFPVSWKQKKRNKFLWRPECGESTPDLDLRVREMLATFARELSGQRVVCVTHEDVMWAFRFRLEKLTIDQWLAMGDEKIHEIPNCGILHYTRADEAGKVHPKFVRVRLVDPRVPSNEHDWWSVSRPRFSNEDLLNQLEDLPPLWADGRG